MAANRQQGTYLGMFLLGFTMLPAGLVLRTSHFAAGIVLAVAGVGLTARALLGAYRIKPLESTNQG